MNIPFVKAYKVRWRPATDKTSNRMLILSCETNINTTLHSSGEGLDLERAIRHIELMGQKVVGRFNSKDDVYLIVE